MFELHQAAYDGNHDDASRLLGNGSDPNQLDEQGWSPLHWLAFKGLCGRDREETLQALVVAGAYINARTDDGQPMLVLACQAGSPELVRQIIAVGADVNVRSGNETPLTAAAQSGCAECVRLLLAFSADQAAVGSFGLTAEEWAESLGFDRVIAVLQENEPAGNP